MTTQTHYSRAPITEAIIDFRVELPTGTTVDRLQRCGIEERERYPEMSLLKHMGLQSEISDNPNPSAVTQHRGFVFRNLDGKQVFQTQLDGFSFHRLAPYDSWRTFRSEAHRLWDVYSRAAQPTRVMRVAVRYVNRLDLPHPLSELKDYLKTSPEVSPELLEKTVAGFFMQLNIPQKDIGATLILTQAIAQPESAHVMPIILDIDLFRDSGLPTVEADLWAYLEVLHFRKNQIFEGCITDRVREMIR